MKLLPFFIAIFAALTCILATNETAKKSSFLHLDSSKKFLLPNETLTEFYCQIGPNFSVSKQGGSWIDFYVNGQLAGAQIYNHFSKYILITK